MKILYVEDDDCIAKVAKHLFVYTENILIFSRTIKDAKLVVATCRESIGAIILDITLSDATGIDLLNFMVQSKINVPVIITTGNFHVYEKEIGMFSGDKGPVKYILKKPFNPKELIDCLKSLEKPSLQI